jgi:hypothetical protein
LKEPSFPESGPLSRALSSLFIAVLLIASLTFLASPGSAQQSPAPERRLGFGFIGVGGLIDAGYTPQQFFKGMFLTPPYPSTVELTVEDNSGTGAVFQQNSTVTRWLLAEMQLVSTLPDIKMVVHVAFDLSSTSAWANLEGGMLASLKESQYSSTIGAFGFDIEQTNVLTNNQPGCSGGSCTISIWQTSLLTLSLAVIADGWQFNSYYPQGISAVPDISKYDYWQSSQPWAPQLSVYSPNTVGINIGGNGLDPFPSPECDYAGNPHWTITPFPQGYFPDPSFPNSGPCSAAWPATLDQVLQIENSISATYRQWVVIYAGNNGTGFCSPTGCDYASDFVGASGISTSANWDNPAFRDAIYEWIQSNPNTYFLDGAQSEYTSTTSLSTGSSSKSVTSTVSSNTMTTTSESTSQSCPSCTTSSVTSTGNTTVTNLLLPTLGLAYVFGFALLSVWVISGTGIVRGRGSKQGEDHGRG